MKIKQQSIPWEIIVPCLGMMLLAVLKFAHFELPFFWDESWSYGKAVAVMVEQGPTLNPASVDQEVFRGHPLFFYFLTSGVGKLFGFNPIVMHSYMFLISTVLLVWYGYVIKRWFGQRVSIIATVIVFTNQMFAVQSSFLLPEVLIGFLCVITVYYFLEKNFILYFITGSALILTKESAVVLFAVLGLFLLINSIREHLAFKKLLRAGFFYAAPILVYVLFLCIQKMKWGWFLFPAHVDLMDFAFGTIKGRLVKSYAVLFYFYENIVFVGMVLLSTILLFLGFSKRERFSRKQQDVLLIVFLFAIGYSLFTAINFYTLRYLLALFFMLVIPIAVVVGRVQLSGVYQTILSVVFIATMLFVVLIRPYRLAERVGDCSWGYVNAVQVRQQLINRAISDHPKATFFAGFLMGVNMRDSRLAYVRPNQMPKMVEIDQAEFALVSKIEENEWYMPTIQDTNQFQVVLEIEEKNFWGRLYKRK